MRIEQSARSRQRTAIRDELSQCTTPWRKGWVAVRRLCDCARVDISFRRLGVDGAHTVRVVRDDGVVFEIRPGIRKGYVPHDMGHLLTEQAYGLKGFWASVAAGALFQSLMLVEGRLANDARARSKTIIKENATGVGLGEILGESAYAAAEHGHDVETAFKGLGRTWGSVSAAPLPFNREVVADAIEAFRNARARWQAVPVGDEMLMTWRAERGRRRRR